MGAGPIPPALIMCIQPISRSACVRAKSVASVAFGPTARKSIFPPIRRAFTPALTIKCPTRSSKPSKVAGLHPPIMGWHISYSNRCRSPLLAIVFRNSPFEIFRPIDRLSKQIRGVSLIPGCGEFAYAPAPVTREIGRASTAFVNVHTHQGGTNWDVALNQLQSSLPNAKSVSLVVSWFGTSLDAAECRLRPLVESADLVTNPQLWSVAGTQRNSAALVSTIDNRPAFWRHAI